MPRRAGLVTLLVAGFCATSLGEALLKSTDSQRAESYSQHLDFEDSPLAPGEQRIAFAELAAQLKRASHHPREEEEYPSAPAPRTPAYQEEPAVPETLPSFPRRHFRANAPAAHAAETSLTPEVEGREGQGEARFEARRAARVFRGGKTRNAGTAHAQQAAQELGGSASASGGASSKEESKVGASGGEQKQSGSGASGGAGGGGGSKAGESAKSSSGLLSPEQLGDLLNGGIGGNPADTGPPNPPPPPSVPPGLLGGGEDPNDVGGISN